MTIVGFLSDFGLIDPFVAEVKAVILGICPEAKIVDITHEVKKFDIRMGAFLLASAAPNFPDGTVHVAVVDPGVGSKRRPIVVESRRSLYLGPDNGLLIPAAQRDGIVHVYELTNRSLMRETISTTFHGRDVFAPVAAHLACGTLAKECGSEISNYMKPIHSEPKFVGRTALCEVFHIDAFGNIITNLTIAHLNGSLGLKPGKKLALQVGRKRVRATFVRSYSDLKARELGILFDSHGFLEIALRESNAARRLRLRRGGVFRVDFA